MDKSEKKIPTKNYFLLGGIVMVSIFLVYYFYLWFQTYEESKLNVPIMNEYLQVINYNELSSYLLENESTTVYVSIVGDEDVRNFEKKFKNTITKYSLKDKMLYMDISNELSNGNHLNYGLNSESLPCILSFEGNELIDTYDIGGTDYNIKKIRKYLLTMGVIDED